MPFKLVKFPYYFTRSVDTSFAKYNKYGAVEAMSNHCLLVVPKECDRAVRACLKV